MIISTLLKLVVFCLFLLFFFKISGGGGGLLLLTLPNHYKNLQDLFVIDLNMSGLMMQASMNENDFHE